MADCFDTLEPRHIDFVRAQHLFFVATAARDGKVNLSPKGGDSLRVISPSRLLWLNLTGSGNETAAHLRVSNRMTLMFCSFERSPLILRIYGSAGKIQEGDEGWGEEVARFGTPLGARQVYDLAIEMVQTSCGFAVPRFDFLGDRDTLARWTEKHGARGIRDYWTEKNRVSLDGLPTGIPSGQS